MIRRSGAGSTIRNISGQIGANYESRIGRNRKGNRGFNVGKKYPKFIDLVEGTCDEFLAERSQVDGFWRKIEEEYHDRRTERLGSYADIVDAIPAGHVYQFVHATEGQTHGRPPKFFAKAVRQDRQDIAKLFEDAHNAEWSLDGSLDVEPKLALRDTIKKGFGVTITEFTGDMNQDYAERLARREMQSKDPTMSAILSGLENDAAMVESVGPVPPKTLDYELDSRRLRGNSLTRRVSPWDFFCDPSAGSMGAVTCIGREMVADLEMLKRHPKMGGRARALHAEMLEAQSRDRNFRRARNFSERRPRVLLKEAYYIDMGGEWKKLVYSAASRTVLFHEPSPYWFGHPYSVCRWNEDGDNFLPQSDFTNIWQLQAAVQLLMTRTIQGFARLQNSPTFFNKTTGFNPADIESMTNPEIGLMIGIAGSDDGKALGNQFYRPPNDPVIGTAVPILNILAQQLQIASGQGANQQGGALKSETSATEAREIANQAALRASHRSRAYERFVLDIARKRMSLMAQFYDTVDMARIVGMAAKAWPNNFLEGDIHNGLFLHIEQGSMTPLNDRSRFAQIAELLGVVSQIPGGLQVVNMPELLGRLMEALGLRRDDPIIQITDPAEAGAVVEAARAAQNAPQGSQPARGAVPSGEAGIAQATAGR